MNTFIASGDKLAHQKTVVVRVRYAAAKQPFVDSHAQAAESIAAFKTRVLTHFHLVEGAVDGGSKTYQLSHGEVVLADPNVTLGSLIEHGKQVELLLIEQFTQG